MDVVAHKYFGLRYSLPTEKDTNNLKGVMSYECRSTRMQQPLTIHIILLTLDFPLFACLVS